MNVKRFFSKFARGCSLGLGMVPGVSAGTMAIIANVYDDLIDNISGLRKNFKHCFIELIPLLLGIVLSSIAILVAVHFGYASATFVITCVFAGLMIGTLPIIYKPTNLRVNSGRKSIGLIIGIIVAAGIGIGSVFAKIYSNLDFSQAFINGVWWAYILCFIAGFIAMFSCVIPGISGSMILFIFGLYQPCLEIFLGESSVFHNPSRILSAIGLVLSLAIGAILGLLVAVKGMKGLLAKHKEMTFSIVFGFVLGSIVSIFCNQALLDANNVWAYQTTPLWGWILGPILLIGVSIASYFLIARPQVKK